MLHWALVFFILSGVFGFLEIGADGAGIARVLFLGFLVLSVASVLLGLAPTANRWAGGRAAGSRARRPSF